MRLEDGEGLVPDSIPVLFDTDIGSDIDDALALAYLLLQPRCELLGVTTVTGDVSKRAALVQVLCEAAGRPDLPIHGGASDVLLYGSGQPDVPQYEALQHLIRRTHWPTNTAIDFMRRTIRERPGEITLVSVGPMTNVALLFATDPEIAPMLKSWISMAGVFTDEPDMPGEWNSICDPLATAVAFRAPVPIHVHVGLDVTLKCRWPARDVRARFRGPVGSLVLQMAEVWFEKKREVIFHDPLAVVLPFRPEVCGYERGAVAVDAMSGRTSFRCDDAGHNLVAMQVDTDAFFEEYLGTTLQP